MQLDSVTRQRVSLLRAARSVPFVNQLLTYGEG